MRLLHLAMIAVSLQLFGAAPTKQEPFFEQGLPLPDGKFPASYNAPAGVEFDSSWDLEVNAAFIYWYFGQDTMDVAYTAPVLATSVSGSVVNQSFGYKPGFKVGLGVDTHFDNWTVQGEYTWLHHSTTTAVYSASGLVPNDWFQPTNSTKYHNISSTWGMNLDMLDVVVGRPFYQGKQVSVSPTIGLQSFCLRQDLTIAMTNVVAGGVNGTYKGHSHGWALGPEANVNSQWIFWKKLRMDAIMGASLLYTRYTTITNGQTTPTTSVTSQVTNIGAVRPTANLGLGLVYGDYFFSNKWFIDLSARYDFLQFWSQNVMRNYASQLAGYDDGIGDLRLHGLTVNLRCDF